jgi:hypothetical protein
LSGAWPQQTISRTSAPDSCVERACNGDTFARLVKVSGTVCVPLTYQAHETGLQQ